MPAIPKRPGIVTFVAVVMIILGTLAVLGGVCGVVASGFSALIQQAAPKEPAQQFDAAALEKFLDKDVPGYSIILIVQKVISFAVGVLQIAIGIGLFRLRPSARRWAIILTIAHLIYATGSGIYHAVFTLPAVDKFISEHPIVPAGGQPLPFDLGKLLITLMPIFAGCGFAFELTIALLILIGLNTQSAKIAFGVIPSPAGDSEDDDRQRRRYEGYDDEDER